MSNWLDNASGIEKHDRVPDRAFLFSALRLPGTMLFDSSLQDNENNNNFLFHSPHKIVTANSLKDIPGVFETIEEYLKQGKWIAGYFGYECGYHFENIVRDFGNRTSLPLVYLGVYNSSLIVPQESLEIDIPSTKINVHEPHLSISVSTYFHTIERLIKYIVNGDTYQVNFTDKYEFNFSGDDLELYLLLREKQHVSYGAFLNFDDVQILSFSPELFFRRNGNTILTKPMKGTCKRGRTLIEDNAFVDWLRKDKKNRSENLMIVDLIRNDLGRICEPGSVSVNEMFTVEKYQTILQMTSTIQGLLKTEISYYDIFKALYPSGSVTGAPKIRTMQIISEMERHQRGVYCGAIGFISPEKNSVFNVAIRTVVLNGIKGTLGVGSGIVFDSDPQKEYEECALKAEFLVSEPVQFRLLETILWDNGYKFLKEHLKRIEQSAQYFFFPYEKVKIVALLSNKEKYFTRNLQYRVRVLLHKSGEPFIEATEITTDQLNPIIKIAPERTNSADKFFFHKTTHRPLYDKYSQKAQQEKIADYFFLNEKNEVTEGTISNVFIEQNGKLLTPPVTCGLLAGIYRQHVLRTNHLAIEQVLTLNDLLKADKFYMCNSVRGWHQVWLGED